MSKVRAYLQLIRLPNLFTAMADIMAGVWVAVGISGMTLSGAVLALLFSSTCLYAMGVVLNDYFDRKLDQAERPERPIPSGSVTPAAAVGLGIILGIAGVALASMVNGMSLVLALIIVFLIVLYDRYAKHHAVLGPITMGLCRGFNLLLGISFVPDQVLAYWWLAGFGVLYITSVTLLARGEVGEGVYPVRVRAMAMVIVICAIGATMLSTPSSRTVTLFAVFAFILWTFYGLGPALRKSVASNIRRAVGKCIVALPLLDAAIAAPFGGWAAFLSVVIFMIASYSLARLFAVT